MYRCSWLSWNDGPLHSVGHPICSRSFHWIPSKKGLTCFVSISSDICKSSPSEKNIICNVGTLWYNISQFSTLQSVICIIYSVQQVNLFIIDNWSFLFIILMPIKNNFIVNTIISIYIKDLITDVSSSSYTSQIGLSSSLSRYSSNS